VLNENLALNGWRGFVPSEDKALDVGFYTRFHYLPDLRGVNGMKYSGTPRVLGEALDRLGAIKIAQLSEEALVFGG
jgi:hypothetical protein